MGYIIQSIHEIFFSFYVLGEQSQILPAVVGVFGVWLDELEAFWAIDVGERVGPLLVEVFLAFLVEHGHAVGEVGASARSPAVMVVVMSRRCLIVIAGGRRGCLGGCRCDHLSCDGCHLDQKANTIV